MLNASSIKKCCRCIQLQSKLEKPETLYKGNNYKGILLIGESPHKKWLITGSPFRDEKNRLLPSARNIEKYLVILGYDLKDVALIEIVKCVVEDRKNLSVMMENCSGYLMDQVKELNPQRVIILGQKSVGVVAKILSQDLKMLSRTIVDGREYIALYHPSPINQNNHKRNLAFLVHYLQ
jgi:uracil-DNA glycosylase family 4